MPFAAILIPHIMGGKHPRPLPLPVEKANVSQTTGHQDLRCVRLTSVRAWLAQSMTGQTN